MPLLAVARLVSPLGFLKAEVTVAVVRGEEMITLLLLQAPIPLMGGPRTGELEAGSRPPPPLL